VPERIFEKEDAQPTVETLGKGGSARYLPLVHADGLAMIDCHQGHVEEGSLLSFLSFSQLAWT
jgi:molybdopterin biosynthesis enzyme